jgi:hypothetical protein
VGSYEEVFHTEARANQVNRSTLLAGDHILSSGKRSLQRDMYIRTWILRNTGSLPDFLPAALLKSASSPGAFWSCPTNVETLS